VGLDQYFRDRIKKFYEINGRNFFWRENNITPFQVMIAELLLKKTRAENVHKYVYNFVTKHKNNMALFNLNDKDISKLIKPLGLANQRTAAIRQVINYLHENYDNQVPNNYENLKEIPYIGEYTAGAIMCFAFNKRYPVLDVNSSRIISRFFSLKNDKDLRDNPILKQKSLELLPRKKFKEYNWGLLDLGAIKCKTNPICKNCILKRKCKYYND